MIHALRLISFSRSTRRTVTAFGAGVLAASLLIAPPARAFSLGDLTKQEAAGGLKEALTQGATKAVDLLGKNNGFLDNPQVRIPLPGHLQKAADLMRKLGLGQQAEALVASMNHAAETAVPKAKPLLVNAIKQMSVTDAQNILTGADDAATQYFRSKTAGPLADQFRPIVKQSIAKVRLAQQYNAFAGKAAGLGLIKPQDAQLDSYITQKAMDGVFTMIAEEERAIRKDPVGAAGNLAKKVFGLLR
jgi:hypothetical protein